MTKLLTALIGASALAFSATAGATLYDFHLASDGYQQDSVVSGGIYAAQGLTLIADSGDLVTACGGECLTSPGGDYYGGLSGAFNYDVYALVISGVTASTTYQFFDASNNLLGQVSSPNGTAPDSYLGTAVTYSFSSATAIRSFHADFNYDAITQFSTDTDAPADVPEPAMLGLFGLGAIGLGFSRRRKTA